MKKVVLLLVLLLLVVSLPAFADYRQEVLDELDPSKYIITDDVKDEVIEFFYDLEKYYYKNEASFFWLLADYGVFNGDFPSARAFYFDHYDDLSFLNSRDFVNNVDWGNMVYKAVDYAKPGYFSTTPEGQLCMVLEVDEKNNKVKVFHYKPDDPEFEDKEEVIYATYDLDELGQFINLLNPYDEHIVREKGYLPFKQPYIYGDQNGDLMADKFVTRAELLTMLCRIAEIDTSSTDEPPKFVDVTDKDKWYYDYVQASEKLGLINGFEDGTFRPEDPVTPAQMGSVIKRLLDNLGYDYKPRRDYIFEFIERTDNHYELESTDGLLDDVVIYSSRVDQWKLFLTDPESCDVPVSKDSWIYQDGEFEWVFPLFNPSYMSEREIYVIDEFSARYGAIGNVNSPMTRGQVAVVLNAITGRLRFGAYGDDAKEHSGELSFATVRANVDISSHGNYMMSQNDWILLPCRSIF